AVHDNGPILGIQPLGERGRARHIGKEDGSELALPLDRSRGGERRPAIAAEPRRIGIIRAAIRAGYHRGYASPQYTAPWAPGRRHPLGWLDSKPYRSHNNRTRIPPIKDLWAAASPVCREPSGGTTSLRPASSKLGLVVRIGRLAHPCSAENPLSDG